MGEAKRREELGLPPRQKNELNKFNSKIQWILTETNQGGNHGFI